MGKQSPQELLFLSQEHPRGVTPGVTPWWSQYWPMVVCEPMAELAPNAKSQKHQTCIATTQTHPLYQIFLK